MSQQLQVDNLSFPAESNVNDFMGGLLRNALEIIRSLGKGHFQGKRTLNQLKSINVSCVVAMVIVIFVSIFYLNLYTSKGLFF